ncbi:ground-like domain protein [Cooperia oncophora]
MYHPPPPPPQPKYYPPPQPMYHPPPPPQPKYYPPPQPKYHPPPPPPSYSAPQPTYSAPKPMTYMEQPPPSSGGYMTGGYRRHRTKRSGNLIGVSSDLECNNSMLKKIMKKVMTEDEAESRSNISAAIRGKTANWQCSARQVHSKFTISDNAEFCAVRNTKLTCYAFTF